MILIQDGSQPPNIDKPLRIIGDPYKVQVSSLEMVLCWWEMFLPLLTFQLIVLSCVAFVASKGDGE